MAKYRIVAADLRSQGWAPDGEPTDYQCGPFQALDGWEGEADDPDAHLKAYLAETGEEVVPGEEHPAIYGIPAGLVAWVVTRSPTTDPTGDEAAYWLVGVREAQSTS